MSAAAPRPGLGDHLRVLLLLGATLLGALPFVLFAPLGPLLRRVLRARLRRRLELAAARPAAAARPVPPPCAGWSGRTLFLVAGEPSGDRLVAPVVAALRRRAPGLVVRGWAGPASAVAGAALDRDLTPHAVMGVLPVLRTLPTWWRLCTEFLARLRQQPPDLLLTVDFPGLNGRLAAWARRRGVPTVHLVAPAVWAYGPWRLGRWRRSLTRLLALYPFEPALFEGSGLLAEHVGHPLFEAPLPPPRTPERWPGGGPVTLELLPGSRRGEVLAHVPPFVEAAAALAARLSEAHVVMRLAREEHRALAERALLRARARPERLRIDVGPQPLPAPLLSALAASGTVTAELASGLVPHVAAYRVPWPARVGAELGLTAPFVCLVNLVAGRLLVPEHLFTRRGASARLTRSWAGVALSEEAWARQRAGLGAVRERLEVPAVAERIADAVLSVPPRR